jgi:hypothetical protein
MEEQLTHFVAMLVYVKILKVCLYHCASWRR